MKINREELLKQLQAVTPGLSPKELIEQSSCFVFKDNKVITYNDEIACIHDCCLAAEGAIMAKSFITILQKLSEEELEVEQVDGELILSGKRRKVGVRMEQEILLPIDTLEQPKHWQDLSEDFNDAVKRVKFCAGNDMSQFITTCINITPDFLEASDNYQAGRFTVTTGIKDSILVKKTSLSYIVSLDMTQMSETKSWIHFKNPSGLVLSCRKYIEDYPTEELSKHLQVKGTKTQLPKGIKDAVAKAEVFSMENVDDNFVTIHLQENKLRIKGKGVSGWYTESKKIKYKGEEMSFTISPQLLADVSKNYNECEITKDKIKVNSGKFSYVTVLNPIEPKKKKGKKNEGKERKKKDSN
jgi:hypothetical protein